LPQQRQGGLKDILPFRVSVALFRFSTNYFNKDHSAKSLSSRERVFYIASIFSAAPHKLTTCRGNRQSEQLRFVKSDDGSVLQRHCGLSKENMFSEKPYKGLPWTKP
jgi:hypothetical protein